MRPKCKRMGHEWVTPLHLPEILLGVPRDAALMADENSKNSADSSVLRAAVRSLEGAVTLNH